MRKKYFCLKKHHFFPNPEFGAGVVCFLTDF